MTDSEITVQDFDENTPTAVSTAANVDTKSMVGAGSKTVHRQVMCIGDKATFGNVANVTPAGALQVDGSGVTQPISASSLPLPSGAATSAKQDTQTTALGLIATQATLAQIKTQTDNLDVALSDLTTPADTQPVSAASLPLPSGASTESTLALIKAKTDNLDVALSTRTKPADTQAISVASLPLPTDAATQTTLALIKAKTDNIDVALSTKALEAGGNLATIAAKDFATQTTLAAIKTKTDNIDVANSTLSTAAKQDTQITSLAAIKTSVETIDNAIAGSEMQVDVVTLPSTDVTEDAAAAANPTGPQLMARRKDSLASEVTTDGDHIALNSTNKGELYVKQTDVVPINDNSSSLTVDNPALSVVGGGSEAAAQRVTIANDSTGVLTVEVLGLVGISSSGIHDSSLQPGNTLTIAGASQNMDDTAPPNRVNAEDDVVRLATDRDGAIFVHPHGPQIWSKHVDTSTAQTDTEIHAAPGAGLSIYITDIIVATGNATAMNIFFEEGSTKVLGPYYLQAVAGVGLVIHFVTPKKITANTAVTFTTNASIAQAIDITGYIAQG